MPRPHRARTRTRIHRRLNSRSLSARRFNPAFGRFFLSPSPASKPPKKSPPAIARGGTSASTANLKSQRTPTRPAPNPHRHPPALSLLYVLCPSPSPPTSSRGASCSIMRNVAGLPFFDGASGQRSKPVAVEAAHQTAPSPVRRNPTCAATTPLFLFFCQPPPFYTTRLSPLPWTTSPITHAACFSALIALSTASAWSAATMMTMPMPMLKT